MTTTTDYDIVGSFNNQRISNIDAERSINCFEYLDPLGKKPKSLIGTSGLINANATFSGATGGFRAQYTFNGVEFVVIGSSIYRISAPQTISLIGALANTTAGYVGIDANTFQVIFVDGVNGYIWDTTANTFTMITDSSFPTVPIDVCTLDGFFVVAQGNTPNFFLSSLNQGLVWGPAANNFTVATNDILTIGASTIGGSAGTANYETGVSFVVSSTGTLPTGLAVSTTYYAIKINGTTIKVATSLANAQAGTFISITSGTGSGTFTITSFGQLQQGAVTTHPGNIVACRTLHRRLFLFSAFFTEVWENAGIGTTLPFRRNNALLMEYGTPAIGSIATGFDIMIFLSQSRDGIGAVMQVSGTESMPISTNALDFVLAGYAAANQVADCRSFLVREKSLIFYRMNFTAANHTFVYNQTQSDPSGDATKFWNEEETLDKNRSVMQTHAYFNGKNYVGHYALPILYILDSDTFTNDGEAIHRTRITKAFVPPGYQRIRIDRLQVDMRQGDLSTLQPSFEILDLLTEDNFILETESALDIELEQESILYDPTTPYLFMSISKDGGQSYGYISRAPMGTFGNRTFRTLYRKLGTTVRGQAFVAKFEFYDAVRFVILGASWAIEVLPE